MITLIKAIYKVSHEFYCNNPNGAWTFSLIDDGRFVYTTNNSNTPMYYGGGTILYISRKI